MTKPPQLPRSNTAGAGRRIRFRLIQLIAHGDAIVINASIHAAAAPLEVRRLNPERGLLVDNNVFHIPPEGPEREK